MSVSTYKHTYMQSAVQLVKFVKIVKYFCKTIYMTQTVATVLLYIYILLFVNKH